jgi:CubicO group peptidase (beta-lactamase class C family)
VATETLTVGGEVAAGFERVRDAFAQCLSDAGRGGFAYAAYRDGEKVVDLWTEPQWDAGTTPLWMSVTKAFTALCMAMLVDRGKLDVDAPVAEYWPEFAANGKGAITTSHVLTHRSGVLGSQALTDLIDLNDGTGLDRRDDIAAALAGAAPFWEPGTKAGYHTLTYGWLLGEIVRRVDGRDLGAFFHDEVASPLGVPGVFIGTPADRHETIPRIEPTMTPESTPEVVRQYTEHLMALARDPATPTGLSCMARDGVGALDRIPEIFNNPTGRIAPLGGSNLCGTAADVALIFGAIAANDGLVSPAVLGDFRRVRTDEVDVCLLVPINRALGFWRNIAIEGRPQLFGPNDEAFGHTGFGGQIGFSDPESRVGAGFVRSHYTSFSATPMLLNAALYESL